MKNARNFYEENIIREERELVRIKKVCSILSIGRLVIVILAAASIYYLYRGGEYVNSFTYLAMYLLIFILVAYFHNIELEKKRKSELFIEINNRGIKRITGQWREFEDNGEELSVEEHEYINDLDIFGRSSLFQWINSTRTRLGRAALANILKMKQLPSKKEIVERQEAIKELGEKVHWRQTLEVKSIYKKGGIKDIDELLTWAETKKDVSTLFKFVPYIFITITTILIIVAAFRKIPVTYLILIFMINYLVVKLLTRNLVNVVELFQRHKSDIEAYNNILNLIEDETFNSTLLNKLKDNLNCNVSCKREIKALKNLIDWIGDSSANPYYFFFNITILSDIFILSNLEKWRRSNGEYFRVWLETMGEFEALASISNIAFDFSDWSYSEILEVGGIKGENIGHPILGGKSKVNNFSLLGEDKVALITGSNMSGKSTFLRTIGLNLILSYIGAPTYSSKFQCGIFNIYTCMRTKDNLEESISSFYAEILRIKFLVEAAKNGERVFFLLDEIFKGTNSSDRHKGAKVLINQLINAGAIGLVSTHDLELCDLEQKKSWLVNYNFQEYYEAGKIKFDYKLRRGRSTTTNAIHLMKLAGIDFE